jgi:hypothetical protein
MPPHELEKSIAPDGGTPEHYADNVVSPGACSCHTYSPSAISSFGLLFSLCLFVLIALRRSPYRV